MASELHSIDITNVPELRELAEEVRRSREARVLRVNSEDVALLLPVDPSRRGRRRVKTRADDDLFLSSAGGWKGLVDTEQLKADIAESRKRSTRPPIDL